MNKTNWNDLTKMYIEETFDKKYITTPAIEALIAENPIKEKEVLDIGCGTGHFSRILAREGASVVGIDTMSNMIEHCTKNQFGENEIYIQRSGTDLSYFFDDFDAIFCVTVLCCLDQRTDFFKILQQAAKCLKSDGSFYVINHHPLAYHTINNPYFTTKIDESFDYFGSPQPFELKLRTVETGKQITITDWHWNMEDYLDAASRAGLHLHKLQALKPNAVALKEIPYTRVFLRKPFYQLMEFRK